jgi:polyisoprenoid-binding protein YceI
MIHEVVMNFVVLFAALFICNMAHAKVWAVRTGTLNTVTWEAQGFPGFLRINGEGGRVSGKVVERGGKISGRFIVDLRKFTTGMTLRDEHMHDKYLESGKYKRAFLDIRGVSFADGDHKFNGNLKIKNQTRPITGDIHFKRKGNRVHVEASMDVVISGYPSVGVPAYKGITVAEKVKVDAVFDLVPQ